MHIYLFIIRDFKTTSWPLLPPCVTGCFCVFNSPHTLEYIRCSLEKTLLSDLHRHGRLPFQGLPIVIVLAHNPEVSEKGLMYLRDEGQELADRCGRGLGGEWDLWGLKLLVGPRQIICFEALTAYNRFGPVTRYSKDVLQTIQSLVILRWQISCQFH